MASTREIKEYMKNEVDWENGTTATQMAEQACNHFDDWDQFDEIPDKYFEIADEVMIELEELEDDNHQGIR